MNKVILMGRLTSDPEVRYAQSRESMLIARYTLAVRKRKSKEDEPDAEFIDIVAFHKQAEFAEKYLKKGMMIAVTGRLHKDIWEDAEHGKHSRVEVIIDEQHFTSGKNEHPMHGVESEIASTQIDSNSFNEDDLPF